MSTATAVARTASLPGSEAPTAGAAPRPSAATTLVEAPPASSPTRRAARADEIDISGGE